ncbi:hypothetical protein [Streptomyces sp. NPDC057966]|uniref:hypothetical protein n=1 Tax=Streptomyces sp. NPDC057966 TaxID=3346292 RepID=UPI0036E49BE1
MSNESPETHQADAVRKAKALLAEFAGLLASIDSSPMPHPKRAVRQHWHYLCRRKMLLNGLVNDVQALSAAHESAGNPHAARALSELGEHYQREYALAARAVQIHKAAIARLIRRSADHRTILGIWEASQ